MLREEIGVRGVDEAEDVEATLRQRPLSQNVFFGKLELERTIRKRSIALAGASSPAFEASELAN